MTVSCECKNNQWPTRDALDTPGSSRGKYLLETMNLILAVYWSTFELNINLLSKSYSHKKLNQCLHLTVGGCVVLYKTGMQLSKHQRSKPSPRFGSQKSINTSEKQLLWRCWASSQEEGRDTIGNTSVGLNWVDRISERWLSWNSRCVLEFFSSGIVWLVTCDVWCETLRDESVILIRLMPGVPSCHKRASSD